MDTRARTHLVTDEMGKVVLWLGHVLSQERRQAPGEVQHMHLLSGFHLHQPWQLRRVVLRSVARKFRQRDVLVRHLAKRLARHALEVVQGPWPPHHDR